MNNFFSTMDSIKSLLGKRNYKKIFSEYFKKPHYREFFYYKIEKDRDPSALQAMVDYGCIGNDVRQQLRYIRSIATKEPEAVVAAILDNKVFTSDPWSVIDAIEAIRVILIGTKRIDELIQRVIDIDDSYLSDYSPLVRTYTNLILHLIDNKKYDFAFNLAERLFALTSKGEKLAPKFDIYHYGEMLEKVVPGLVKAKGLTALTWICDRLKEVIEADTDKKEQPEDNVFVMRPNIESPKYRMEELSDVLIDAVIISSKEIIQDKSKLKDVCDLLEGYNWDTFTRIMIYLLIDSDDKKLIAEKLLDKRYFFKQGLYREYYQLLKKHYQELDPKQKDGIMTMIDSDEYLLDLRKRKIIKRDDRYENLKRERKYRHLSAIEEYLSGKARDDFYALREELGDKVEDIEYGTPQTRVLMGPKSPYGKEALESLSIDKLIVTLENFEPSKDFMAASREGLGRIVSDVISDNPSKYAGEVDKFMELDQPIYIRNILWGFNQALRKQNGFDWMPVITLLSKVVARKDDPKLEPKEEHHDDNLANWGTAKSSMASLVYEGLNAKKELELPADAADTIYNIIKELLNDPNPTVEEDDKYSGTRSYFDYAINTTRGKSMECLIKYVLWIREGIKNDRGDDFVLEKGFEVSERMKDVRTDFEHVLKNEKTRTVMAVFGRWLPWLVLIDKQWCHKNKDKILPKGDDNNEKHAAVWQAYIKYNQPYNMVFEIFGDEYKYWVDNWDVIDKEPDKRNESTFSLLQHLVQYYWRAKENDSEKYWFNLEGDGFTFKYVFKKVSPSAIARLMSFVGGMLRNEKSDIPETTKVRIQALWDYRFEVTRKADSGYIDELNEFVDWFISDVFEPVWSFGIMKAILSKVGYPKEDYHLYSYLLHKVDEYPVKVLELLETIFNSSSDDKLQDRLYLHVDTLKKIAVALHKNFKDEDDESRVVALISKIGSLGQYYYSFGEILGYDVK